MGKALPTLSPCPSICAARWGWKDDGFLHSVPYVSPMVLICHPKRVNGRAYSNLRSGHCSKRSTHDEEPDNCSRPSAMAGHIPFPWFDGTAIQRLCRFGDESRGEDRSH